MSRIAIITPEAVSMRMAGPAIRAWNMATVLADANAVRLVSTLTAERTSDAFDVCRREPHTIDDDVRWADVIVTHPGVLRTHPAIAQSDTPLVVDIYDPFHLENLEPGPETDVASRAVTVSHLNSVINDSLRRGDFFLCATERQRDFWLGSLTSLGRVNPATYDADPTLNGLVGVVPFGIPSEPPVKRRPVLRGIVPGIGPDDCVMLWAGGVYNWFDPLTLVDAVDRARHEVPGLRVVFLGMSHPNPNIPPMQAAIDLRARADELGLTNRYVFLNEGWVPYDERADYLLEADIGVSTHLLHVETVFSFRTRILDYLWTGLPVITSDGDVFADLARHEGIGSAVAPGSVDDLADAIVTLASDEETRMRCASNSRRVAARFEWPVVLEPLIRFCSNPAIAADRERPMTVSPGDESARPRRRWRR